MEQPAAYRAAPTRAPAPAAEPDDGSTAQVNVKVSTVTKAAFSRLCDVRRESQREVIERMMEAYIAAAENRALLHLDGTICPISRLVLDLTEECRKQLLALGGNRGNL